MKASALITFAATQYRDLGTTRRVSEATWLAYLNEAQREVCLARPDASSKISTEKMAPGIRQSLPADGHQLLKVLRNMGADGNTPGDVVTICKMDDLDTSNLSWPAGTPAGAIIHYAVDDRFPSVWFVYPPVSSTENVYVELAYGASPDTVEDATDDITIADIYSGPVQTWMVYRACLVDQESQAAQAMAQVLYQEFFQSLGIKTKTDLVISANTQGA